MITVTVASKRPIPAQLGSIGLGKNGTASFRNPLVANTAVLLGLTAVGLLLHHTWLTALPLSAGDWGWISPDRAASWFPWPTVWDSTSGFGLKNFAGLYQHPAAALVTLLMHAGLPWELTEKVLYFWPFAALVLIAPWLLAREILGSARWGLLASLIFSANTYVLVIGTGQLTIGMAEVLAFLVLLAYIRALRQPSLLWSIATILLFAAQAVYELRIAYLTLLLALLYLTILTLAEPHPPIVLRRLGLTFLILATFLGTQAYWWLPLLTYQGDANLPIALSPWVAFMRLGHGITALHPFWTGAAPANFRTTALNPLYFVFPLLAFLPLLARRIRPELLWLSFTALVAAFLIKQNNPPLGIVYEWMFAHIPGWNLFREASKLFFVVALAYSVLVPAALQWLLRVPLRESTLKTTTRAIAVAALGAVCMLSASAYLPLLRGELGGTTRPTREPESFAALSRLVGSDLRIGPILWLGGPTLTDAEPHVFATTSLRHPLVALGGTPESGDPLTQFCFSAASPFCYLDGKLFPFLLSRMGALYAVAPVGDQVGLLPSQTNRAWLLNQVVGVLGPPRLLGSGERALAVWRLAEASPLVTQMPAIAVVNGPPALAAASMPALYSLGIPATYDSNQSYDPRPTISPATVSVLPWINGGCQSPAMGSFAMLGHSSKTSIDVYIGDKRSRLAQLLRPGKTPDWGVYGPVSLQTGFNSIRPVASIELGPCLDWSPLATELLNEGPFNASETRLAVSAERVLAWMDRASGGWVELKRAYDPGWTLSDATRHLTADGLFNLYYVGERKRSVEVPGDRLLMFAFSSARWEAYGKFVSLAFVSAAVVALAFLSRRRQGPSPHGAGASSQGTFRIELGRDLAAAGIALLGVAGLATALSWSGVPSRMPWLPLGSDPYGSSEIYLVIGIGMLLASIIIRSLEGLTCPVRGFVKSESAAG